MSQYLSSGLAAVVEKAVSEAFKSYPQPYGRDYWQDQLLHIVMDNHMGLTCNPCSATCAQLMSLHTYPGINSEPIKQSRYIGGTVGDRES